MFIFKFLMASALISKTFAFLDHWYMIPPLGTVTVLNARDNYTAVLTVTDQPAAIKFESEIPDTLEGYLVAANPAHACAKVDPPPGQAQDDYDEVYRGSKGKAWHLPRRNNIRQDGKRKPKIRRPLTLRLGPAQWVLLASNSGCSHKDKIELAHEAGYKALIIHNVGSNGTEVIGLDDDPLDLLIPSFFVGEYDGRVLREKFTYDNGQDYILLIASQASAFDHILLYMVWTGLGLIFSILVVCLIKPCYSCIIQPWWHRRQERRKRVLMTQAVLALPVIEWRPDVMERFETCVICMDTYVEKDLVRILKCLHGFHMQCIDAWLLKVRRNCPICKAKLQYSPCWEEFSESEISEGNYFTDIAYEPIGGGRYWRNTMRDSSPESESDLVIQSILNRRTLNEASWSCSSSASINLDEASTTGLSSNLNQNSPAIVSCLASVHQSRTSLDVIQIESEDSETAELTLGDTNYFSVSI